jgi:hypothetical protein
MGIDTNRLVEFVDRTWVLTAELAELTAAQELPPAERMRLREVIQTLESILNPDDLISNTTSALSLVPMFTSSELVSTINLASSTEEALRHVMLTSTIPLHWSTIYQRVYAIAHDSLRPQDELSQSGHPGVSRWQYRLSWQMQQLRTEGVVRSTGDGYWMRTDADAPKIQPALFDE